MAAEKKESVSYIKICNDIIKKDLKSVYLLMGEEAYYIDELEKKITDAALTEDEKGFNLAVVYGQDANIENVAKQCRRLPIMSKYQVVIVREAQSSKELDILQNYLKKVVPTTILIICNKHGNLKSKTLLDCIKSCEEAVIFESKKLKESNVSSVIQDYVTSKKCSIDNKSTSMLTDFVGTDLARLFCEVDKLILLLGNNKRITPEIIERNIGISKDFNNFELESAIKTKNALKAYQIIDYFEKNPKNNPTVLTVGLLFSFFANLLLVRTSKDKTEQGLMAQIGAKSKYQVNKFKEAARFYSTAGCVNIIGYIRDFDRKAKGMTSRQNEYQLLRELVYKILHS